MFDIWPIVVTPVGGHTYCQWPIGGGDWAGDDVNACTFGTIDSAIERCKGSPLYSPGGPTGWSGGTMLFGRELLAQ